MNNSNMPARDLGAMPVQNRGARDLGAMPSATSSPSNSIKVGGVPLSLGQRALQGAGNIASSIVQPFASLAATPVQAVAKLAGRPDPYQSMPIPGLGNKPVSVSPLSLEAKGGDLLKAGAEIGAVATAPVTLGGAILAGAGVGAAQAAGGAMQQEKSAGDVFKEGGIGGVVGGATGGLLYGAGKVLQKAGEKLYKFVIPTSKKEAQLLQSYKAKVPFTERIKIALTGAESKAPTTVADTAFKKGLVGTESMLGVQAKKASTSLWDDMISPSLEKSGKQVDMPTFFNEVQAKIIKQTPELSRQKALLEALEAMKEDYAGVTTVSLPQLQSFKEGWAKFVPDKAYQGKPIAGAFNDMKDTAADLAREAIYGATGKEVKQAYFDYGNLKGIQELGQTAMTSGRLKGGFGGFWSAIKDMALTPIGTVGGRTVYRTGQGVELIGKPGALVVADILSPTILESLQSSQETTPETE